MTQRDAQVKAYAQGLYEAATESWVKQLKAVIEGLQADGELQMYLTDPSVDLGLKQEKLFALLPPDSDKEIRNFLTLLLSKNDLKLLESVLEEFVKLVWGGPAPVEVEITSAIPLTDEERELMERRLRATHGDNLAFKYTVDPKILGGLIIRVGDRVIDASLQTKLNRLREQILSAL